MKRHLILTLALATALLGCTATHRGSVAMKVDEREAHVCMGAGEVGPGDRVALFRNECGDRVGQPQRSLPTGGRSGESGCRRVKLGEGRVVRPLNEHYSVVEVDPGVEFEEGAIVEKL